MTVDIFPHKAQYRPGEPVTIHVRYDIPPQEDCTASAELTRLNRTVSVFPVDTTKAEFTFLPPDSTGDLACYGVTLSIRLGGETAASASTAFDVVTRCDRVIRYGFLSDFGPSDGGCEDVEWLAKLHINYVQYYDWSYRHDSLVSEDAEQYRDMMGRTVDLRVVREKITACRQRGMQSLGYAAVYAASKDFHDRHPDWGLYTSTGEPLTFIDVFYIMNIDRRCPWHRHILDEYRRAVEEVGFDGIHMDTYGFPKTAIARYPSGPEVLHLEDEFPPLIRDAKSQLDSRLIFNNVGNWPVGPTAAAPTDAVYIEVWDPYRNYRHIRQIITEARQACPEWKPIILAAYLAPFRTDTPERALNAALLLTAAIAANGASHLLLGEFGGVLTQGYYVDHSTLDAAQTDAVRQYGDFIVRYSELLYDPAMRDVSFTHTGGDNREYQCLRGDWSPDGAPGTLWLTLRESDRYKCIHIVNLCSCGEDVWNCGKPSPEIQRDIDFEVQLDGEPAGVFAASPNFCGGSAVELPYELHRTPRGLTVRFRVGAVRLWSLVYIRLHKENE